MGSSAAATAASTAHWKQLLLTALQSNSLHKHSSYFQLATVGTNGRPSNRTVVFRGFQEESDKIQINTDARTSKIEDLKYCPFAEICWYFTDTWEQFRINGRVDVINAHNPDLVKLQEGWRMKNGKETHFPIRMHVFCKIYQNNIQMKFEKIHCLPELFVSAPVYD